MLRRSAPRCTCRSAARKPPATAIARRELRHSTSSPSGSRCTSTSADACSVRRSTPPNCDRMNWGLVGALYVIGYVLVVSVLTSPHARLLVGNIALLLPPFFTVGVILSRLRLWTGRQRLFWIVIATGAAFWVTGQMVWAYEELARANQLPWFRWFIVVQLCGSALPLIALVATPHKGPRTETAATAAIDVCALACLTAFLYWSLVVAPGMAPQRSTLALRTLATVGPMVRLAAFVGFSWFAWLAGSSPWVQTYRRVASGMLLAFGLLVA